MTERKSFTPPQNGVLHVEIEGGASKSLFVEAESEVTVEWEPTEEGP